MTCIPAQNQFCTPTRLTFGGVHIEMYPSDGAVVVLIDPPAGYSVSFHWGTGRGDTQQFCHKVVISRPLPLPAPEAPPTDVVNTPHNRPTELGLSAEDGIVLDDTDLPLDEWAARSAEHRETANIRLEIGREKLARLIEQAQAGEDEDGPCDKQNAACSGRKAVS